MNYISVSCWNCSKITRKIIKRIEQAIYFKKCNELVLIVDNTLIEDCNNCQWFNMLFITELKLNKSFTCDLCEEIILMVDKELLNQVT